MPIFSDGFEYANLTAMETVGWTGVNGTLQSTIFHQTLDGDGGSYAYETNDSLLSPAFPSANGRWCHFWISSDDNELWNNTWSLYFQEPGTGNTNAAVTFYREGGIEIRRGVGTFLAISATSINTAVGHWIAVEMLADNSGYCAVWVDGVEVVNFTGDLQKEGTAGWDAIRFTGNNTFIVIDDFIITTVEEGRLDECYIVPTTPNADDVTALSPSTGVDNYAMVDELSPSTTDYNEATATAEDFYDMSNLGFTPEKIYSYGHSSWVGRDGTITTGQQGIKSSTTTDRKTAETLAAAPSYQRIQASWTTDPDTSIAIASVNQTSDFFGIAGDVSSDIMVGSFIEVTGSTGNDGTYVVESVAFNTPNTEITVTIEIPNATVDGNLTYNWTTTTLNAAKTGIKFA